MPRRARQGQVHTVAIDRNPILLTTFHAGAKLRPHGRGAGKCRRKYRQEDRPHPDPHRLGLRHRGLPRDHRHPDHRRAPPPGRRPDLQGPQPRRLQPHRRRHHRPPAVRWTRLRHPLGRRGRNGLFPGSLWLSSSSSSQLSRPAAEAPRRRSQPGQARSSSSPPPRPASTRSPRRSPRRRLRRRFPRARRSPSDRPYPPIPRRPLPCSPRLRRPVGVPPRSHRYQAPRRASMAAPEIRAPATRSR